MANPIQQGLKHFAEDSVNDRNFAAMANPIQQGLKLATTISGISTFPGRNG